MDTTHKPLHVEKLSLVQEKITDIRTDFILVVIVFEEGFNYGDGAKFLRLCNLCKQFIYC
jgi:hypothetical protein